MDVFPGQSSVLDYTPPWLTFISGRIGPTAQPRRGAAVLWVLLAILTLLVVAVIVSATLGS